MQLPKNELTLEQKFTIKKLQDESKTYTHEQVAEMIELMLSSYYYMESLAKDLLIEKIGFKHNTQEGTKHSVDNSMELWKEL